MNCGFLKFSLNVLKCSDTIQFLLINGPGMNFMALCHMIRSCVKMFWHDTSLPIGQVNVVGVLTCYGLGSLVFEPRWGGKTFKAYPDQS